MNTLRVNKPVIPIFAFGVILIAAAWMQFYGLDKIALNSDELFRAAYLTGPDWQYNRFNWPDEAERTYFRFWPNHLPVGLSYLIRLSTHIFGETHLGLRVWSFVFAIFSTLFIYFLYRKFFSKSGIWAFIPPILIGSASRPVLENAKALKHYTADLFFTVAILFFAKQLLDDSSRKTTWIGLTLLACVGLFIGFGSFFISVSVYSVLAIKWFTDRKNSSPIKRLLPILLSALFFLFALAVLYHITISQAFTNEGYMAHVARAGYQFFDWKQIRNISYVLYFIARLGMQLIKMPVYFFNSWVWGTMINIFVITAVIKLGQKKQLFTLMLLLLPMGLLILTTFAGKFAFKAERLNLFLIVPYVLLATCGVKYVFDRFRKYGIPANAYLLLCIFGLGLLITKNARDVGRLNIGYSRHVDKMVQTFTQHAKDKDTIYLHWGAILAFYFYGTDHQGFPDTVSLTQGEIDVIYGDEHHLNLEAFKNHYQRLVDIPSRLWVAFGHFYPTEDMALLRSMLANNRALIEEYNFRGCQLLLFSQPDTEPSHD